VTIVSIFALECDFNCVNVLVSRLPKFKVRASAARVIQGQD
jgi:hypothetical protein